MHDPVFWSANLIVAPLTSFSFLMTNTAFQKAKVCNNQEHSKACANKKMHGIFAWPRKTMIYTLGVG